LTGAAIIGLDHVQLAMPPGAEDRARAFYCSVMGMAERPKPPDLAARGGCWFHAPGVELHLGVEADFRAAAKAHPALLVSDLAAMRAHLHRHGVELIDGKPLDGYVRGDVADPFGNRIELMQRL
jgi:catechol 2,3-dioxygenase-like lactoylglutathione lyase family enzyme